LPQSFPKHEISTSSGRKKEILSSRARNFLVTWLELRPRQQVASGGGAQSSELQTCGRRAALLAPLLGSSQLHLVSGRPKLHSDHVRMPN